MVLDRREKAYTGLTYFMTGFNMGFPCHSNTDYPDEKTLQSMVFKLDPMLETDGYYDEQGSETSPGLHQRKLKQTEQLAVALFQIAMKGAQKSQPEGRL